MKRALWLFVLLLTSPLFADVTQLVNEGIALYDAGKYDEAIAKYQAALAEDPSSDLAAYELALAYQAKQDFPQCKAVLEPRLKKKDNPYLSQMYGVLGNCHDMGGDAKRAIETYRRGLKVNGNDTQLLYNLALTLSSRGEYDEARKHLKKELAIRYDHRSGHYLLAKVFHAQNFRIPATLSYLRFLSLESSGPRAKDAAEAAVLLLGAGVERKDEKNVQITIDSNPRKGEGDYGPAEMMIAIAGAAQLVPERAEKSEFERTLAHVSSSLAMIVEAQPAKGDYTSENVIPYFRGLYDRKLLDAYAAVAISSLELKGGDEWRLANAGAIDAYLKLMSGAK